VVLVFLLRAGMWEAEVGRIRQDSDLGIWLGALGVWRIRDKVDFKYCTWGLWQSREAA
jgi:hypothetical protein